MPQPDNVPLPPAANQDSDGGNPHPVDSATRSCCGGIGGHAPDCAVRLAVPLAVASHLAAAGDLTELARAAGNAALLAMPADAQLFAFVDLVAALDHLGQAARLIDRTVVIIGRPVTTGGQ